MNLDNLDRVTLLRDNRALAFRLRDAAREGQLGDFTIWHDGRSSKVFSVISAEPVRSAIIVAAEQLIIRIDTELRQSGVATKSIEQSAATIEDWKRSAEMFSRAWLRSLGGNLLPKSHFIDALVVTTERLVQRAETAERELAALKSPPEADDA